MEIQSNTPGIILYIMGGMILATLLASFTKFSYLTGTFMFMGGGLGALIYLTGVLDYAAASLDSGGSAWSK